MTSALPPPQPEACVLLLQLGGPRTLADIQPFLANLFEDVLPLPRLLRRPLARFIAWRRTPEVTPLYQEIGGGSPLLANTEAQRLALAERLAALGCRAEVITCMRYAPPRVGAALAAARRHRAGIPWVALSLYPHYAFATARSSLRELAGEMAAAEAPQLRAICAYPTHPRYLDAMAARVEEAYATLPEGVAPADVHMVFSAHGLPMSQVRQGDPYPQHIAATVTGVLERLARAPKAHTLCYQSRVGPVKWLEPATLGTLTALGRAGERHVLVVPVAFVSEHIETLHELDIQLRDAAVAAGVQTYRRVAAVGTHPAFIDCLAELVVARLARPERCCGLTPRCDWAAAAPARALPAAGPPAARDATPATG